RVQRDGGRDLRVQVTLAEEVIPHDRTRVSFQEAIEQRARPSLNNAIAHGARDRGAAYGQLRRGSARDRVLEDDLPVRWLNGLVQRRPSRAIRGQPARPDSGLEEGLRVVEAFEAIAIALPGGE